MHAVAALRLGWACSLYLIERKGKEEKHHMGRGWTGRARQRLLGIAFALDEAHSQFDRHQLFFRCVKSN
jgi:hypothetical protein